MEVCLLVGSPRYGRRRRGDGYLGRLGSRRTSGTRCSALGGHTHRNAHSPFLARPTDTYCSLPVSIYIQTQAAHHYPPVMLDRIVNVFEHFGIYSD